MHDRIAALLRRAAEPRLMYAVGSVANSAALLLLLPLLVSRLSQADYGSWALYEVAVLVLSSIALLGLDVGLMREYTANDDAALRRRAVATALSVLAAAALLLFGGLQLAAWLLRPLVCGASCALLAPERVAMVLVLVGADALFQLLLSILRIRGQAAAFALLTFTRLTLFLLGATAALLLGFGLNGALLGRLAAVLAVLPPAVWLVRGELAVGFDRAAAGRLLRYGLPLLPTNLALYVLTAADRFILQASATLELVAVYTFAYKLASGLDVLVIRPFALDWAARRFTIAGGPQPQARYAETLVGYLLAATAAALAIGAAAPLVFALVAPAGYAAGLELLPPLLAALVLFGARYPINIGMMLHSRTDLLPGLSWATAAVGLLLNVWWIPAYGMSGAAWASLVSYSGYSLIIAWASQRLYPLRYPWRRLALIGVMSVGGAAGLWLISRLGAAATIGGALSGLLWIGAVTAGTLRQLARGRAAGE
jgi:O-antigen/teichoic acid export membrane protein